MLRAHAVVDAVEPGLQIGEDEVDHRHELFGHFGFAAFGNCMVVEAPLAQAGIAAPVIGDDQRAWHDGILDKATQRIGAAVSGDGQSHSTGITAILPLVLCRTRLPVANLDSGGHQRFVVDAPAFAARLSADPRIVRPRHALSADPRYGPGPAAPCPRAVCAGCRRRSHIVSAQVAAETALPTSPASGWRRDTRPRTRR